MSPFRGLVNLLVLLGVVFASGKPAQYVSHDLKQSLESIVNELKLKDSDIGENPLFTSVIRSINNSCQDQTKMQLMNATLDVYMQIFSNIFQHSRHNHHHRTQNSGVLSQLDKNEISKVNSTLGQLQRKMEEVKSHLNCPNQSPEDVYSTLNKMKVDDPKVQRKALAEFLTVFQAASDIAFSRPMSNAN